MKQLLVLRHAKSSWDEPGLTDFDRPLNLRGERDAPRLGSWLASMQLQPDALICSPALRTRQTAALVAAEAGFPPDAIRFEANIYEAHLPDLLEIVRTFDERWAQVLLIGHNPGLHELVNTLGDTLIESFPTCALAQLELTGAWRDARPRSAVLRQLVTPKILRTFA